VTFGSVLGLIFVCVVDLVVFFVFFVYFVFFEYFLLVEFGCH